MDRMDEDYEGDGWGGDSPENEVFVMFHLIIILSHKMHGYNFRVIMHILLWFLHSIKVWLFLNTAVRF
jgi:hypothetical protein